MYSNIFPNSLHIVFIFVIITYQEEKCNDFYREKYDLYENCRIYRNTNKPFQTKKMKRLGSLYPLLVVSVHEFIVSVFSLQRYTT